MNRVLVSFIFLALCQWIIAQHTVFNIIDYGASDDGSTLSTSAIQKAIDDCADNGGGTVYLPAGKFVSGTLFLKSFVTLHLESGCVLEGSTNLDDYPVTITKVRSYTDNYTNKSLIYAEDAENISIAGRGVIDGKGASFKVDRLKNDDNLRMKDDWVYYKSRPFMIRMINCRNILIRDVTIIDSPMWVQHYLVCEDVNIDGITVLSRVNDNNDGIDIDGCNRVRIANCYINTGDDAIVLKSTMNTPCRNITVTNCNISSNCNAFKLGTESNGGFQNITFSNSTIFDTRLCGLALELVDGGSLDHVSISNITMNNVGSAIFIRLGDRARPYMENMPKPGKGKLYNIILSNIQAYNINNTGCSITGLPYSPAENITLDNIRLYFRGGGTRDLVDREIPEFPEKYPEHNMFGMLPAYGFYCRHINNLAFHNVELDFLTPDERPAIVCDNVREIDFQRIKAKVVKDQPVIKLINVHDALIQSCKAPEGCKTFLHVAGNDNGRITLTGNDLSRAEKSAKNESNIKIHQQSNRTK